MGRKLTVEQELRNVKAAIALAKAHQQAESATQQSRGPRGGKR